MATENVPGGAEGWDWFNRSEREVEGQRNEDGLSRDEMFRMYESTFGTSQGQLVLKDLMRFRRITFFDPSAGFYDGAAQGFYNAGLNALVTHIERMIAYAQRAK